MRVSAGWGVRQSYGEESACLFVCMYDRLCVCVNKCMCIEPICTCIFLSICVCTFELTYPYISTCVYTCAIMIAHACVYLLYLDIWDEEKERDG